jgi:hypothetical protein
VDRCKDIGVGRIERRTIKARRRPAGLEPSADAAPAFPIRGQHYDGDGYVGHLAALLAARSLEVVASASKEARMSTDERA